MTFVFAAVSPKSMWMLTDRRLSFENRSPRDDARKVMFLDTIDGGAMLGYCGLGSSASGVEPSGWMSNVLRGINAPLETCLGILNDAMVKEMPPHLLRLGRDARPTHNIIVSAFLNERPRIYSIDLILDRRAGGGMRRYTRHITPHIERLGEAAERGVFAMVGGSGAAVFIRHLGRDWLRDFRKIVEAHDKGRLPATAVAAFLARLNDIVHRLDPTGTVGQRSIVTWRYVKGGGADQYFCGRDVEPQTKLHILPTIARGQDMAAFLSVVARHSGSDIDVVALDHELDRLPDKPDSKLR